MTVTRRVKQIHGSPSAEPGVAVLKFTFDNGEESRVSIPSDLLIGLGGMALSFRQGHDGPLSALSVEAIDIINQPDQSAVLICSLGERSMSLPLKLSSRAKSQLLERLRS